MSLSRVLTESLTHAYAKCENSSLVFHPMTLFPKQTYWIYLQCPFDLIKFRVVMHLWAMDFWVLTAGRRTPFQRFLDFHRRLRLNQSGFFTRGGIYSFLLCPTHVFFMLCNHETYFRRCPITELTTNLPRMMNDYNYAHTPDSM